MSVNLNSTAAAAVELNPQRVMVNSNKDASAVEQSFSELLQTGQETSDSDANKLDFRSGDVAPIDAIAKPSVLIADIVVEATLEPGDHDVTGVLGELELTELRQSVADGDKSSVDPNADDVGPIGAAETPSIQFDNQAFEALLEPSDPHAAGVPIELELIEYREFSTHRAFSFQAIGMFGRSGNLDVAHERQTHNTSLVEHPAAELGSERQAQKHLTVLEVTASKNAVSDAVRRSPTFGPFKDIGPMRPSAVLNPGIEAEIDNSQNIVERSIIDETDDGIERRSKLVASRMAKQAVLAGATRIELSLGLEGRKLNVRIRADGLSAADAVELKDGVKSLLAEFGFEVGDIIIEYQNARGDQPTSKGIQDGRA